MDPSLVGNQMSSDAMSEESSSAKERATTRPLVQVMSLRISHLRQGERRQPNPSIARMSVMLRRVRK